jgi:hypothetical protein
MKKFTLLSAAAALAMPVAAYAQETTSTIRGTVTAEGAPVAGAQVRIVHTPSGTETTSETDATGAFNAAGLRVGGPFTVTVEAPNFELTRVTDIFLTAGQPFRLPVELASANQEIVVTASSIRGARETSQGPITTMTRDEIEGVASVTRDIRDIARRDPFANIDASNSRTIEIAGQNGRLNRFSVDGVQLSDDFGLNNGGLPTSRGPVPFDAIEQLSVKVAPYDIEEGDFQGGAINVVLRSGTNRFTGSAFYTFLNEDLTGDKIRGAPLALDFKSEQYGGFLSGPIIPGKLFFAVAYERLKEGDPIDEGPTGLGFANEIPRVTQGTVDQITQIANSRYGFDPLGVFSTATEKDEKLTAKIDWNVTDDHRASLTYIRNIGNQQIAQNNQTSATNPTFGFASNAYELTEEINSGVFQLNSTWSDNLSTELRVSYRDYNREQTPFGGRDIAQFEVCLDPATTGPLTTCTLANASTGTLATPRVFFGPDISRQANDLNTDNLSADFTAEYALGAHTMKFLAGYTRTNVFNLFLQRASGDIYFDSIADFQAGRANRVRLGGTPSGDVNDAAATFGSQTYTVGIQDDIEVSDDLQISIGARYDLFGSNDRPPLNPNFLQRYGFSNRETFAGLGSFQPRFGFTWNTTNRLILRGGIGVFAGGTPDVFLSNSFSNTGQLTNAVDISRNTSAAGCNAPTNLSAANQAAFCAAVLNNVTGKAYPPALLNFLQTNTASFAAAPVNAIDPDFDPSSQLRATLSASYEADLGPLGDRWLLGADFLYGEALRGITYVDLRSVPNGTLIDGRPRYRDLAPGGQFTTNQDLLLTNDNRGRSYIAVARLDKEWDFGLGIGASYTYTDIKDVNPITSATAGSLYANAAMADPNNAAYGRSIYEIRHSAKLSLDYKRAFFGDYETRFSLFGEYRSGRPFSYTFRDPASGRSPVFGTLGNSSRHLMYVPASASDVLVSYDSNGTRDAVNAFIDGTKGLAKYRGSIVPKNTGRSPSVWKVDLHMDQEVPVPGWSRARVKLFADVENVLNLLDSDWGVQRQVNFPYFGNVVNVQCLTAPVATGTAPPANGAGSVATAPTQACAQYRYTSFAEPSVLVQNQNRQSLYQIRLGVRFEF